MSAATREEIAALLRDPGRAFRITAHRNADGDAIGSMLGLARALRSAGRDVVLWHVDSPAAPPDLAFLGEESIEAVRPEAPPGRTLIALDCASAERIGEDPGLLGSPVVNIDHHHDNTRFGDLDLVDPGASSTAEMVVSLLDVAGIAIPPDAAEPLFVGIVTDTGRFGYANAGPGAFAAAGRLVAGGLDLVRLTRALYEGRPVGRARLQARAIDALRLSHGGRVAVSVLTEDDFAAAGEGETEGIVEALRALDGVAVAGLIRPRPGEDGVWRGSLRSHDGGIDVSAVAHRFEGGGHAAAAGCTLRGTADEVAAALATALGAAL